MFYHYADAKAAALGTWQLGVHYVDNLIISSICLPLAAAHKADQASAWGHNKT